MRHHTCCAALLLFLAAGWARADEGSFDSGGVKLHYTNDGRGEPVILVHGFAASGLVNWAMPGISPELAKTYRVITLDNRGHGRSAKPHDPKQYGRAMVEDVVRLMAHLGIKKAHVVGYSMGAFITHRLSIDHPDRLLSATLGGGGWLRGDDPEFKLITGALGKSLDEGKGIFPLLHRLHANDKDEKTLGDRLQVVNKIIMATNDPKALAAVIRAIDELTVSEKEIAGSRVPTLAIVGSRDPLKKGVDELKERRPEVQVVVLEGADHMTALANPLLKQSLKQFLGQHQER